MTYFLVVAEGTDDRYAYGLAILNACSGYYTGIPPVYASMAAEQAWTLPCVLTDDGSGAIVAWIPAVMP